MPTVIDAGFQLTTAVGRDGHAGSRDLHAGLASPAVCLSRSHRRSLRRDRPEPARRAASRPARRARRRAGRPARGCADDRAPSAATSRNRKDADVPAGSLPVFVVAERHGAAAAATLAPPRSCAPRIHGDVPAAAPTFADDVAPIVYANCAVCHRPGQAAPFSLLSYDDVRKHGETIVDVTARRYMPPWHASRAEGFPEFRDERRLSDADLRDAEATGSTPGMPAGDLKKAPLPPMLPERLGARCARSHRDDAARRSTCRPTVPTSIATSRCRRPAGRPVDHRGRFRADARARSCITRCSSSDRRAPWSATTRCCRGSGPGSGGPAAAAASARRPTKRGADSAAGCRA